MSSYSIARRHCPFHSNGIATMYRMRLDMQSRYKKTSLAGFALHIIER
jgi:L-serine deaminase